MLSHFIYTQVDGEVGVFQAPLHCNLPNFPFQQHNRIEITESISEANFLASVQGSWGQRTFQKSLADSFRRVCYAG